MSVEYEERDGVVWIRLNNPAKLNVLDEAGWQGITDALRRAARESLAPVVLTGTGRAFCAGDDIAVFAPLTRDRAEAQRFFVDTLYATFEAIVTHPTPVIAAINGHAFGGGLELVATCDLAVASEDALFGIPEGKLGATPAVFVALAATHFGTKAANAFAFRMATYTAAEALALGVVNVVVPEAQVDQTVSSWVAEILQASPESVAMTKRFLAQPARDLALPRIKAALRATVEELLPTPNLLEGTAAFLEKRRPRFDGRADLSAASPPEPKEIL